MALTPPAATPAPQDFWRATLTDVKARLAADAAGLDAAEAERRLTRYGPNTPGAARPRPLLAGFLSRFRNPLVLILMIASVVSAFTGDTVSSVIVAVIVLISITLDFVQEHRADRAAERLRSSVALRSRTLRDGRWIGVPAAGLVPGDVVELAAGDLAPADGRLLEATDFFVNQALLSGEAYPVEKHAVEAGAETDTAPDAVNAVYAGTAVISGTARFMVCATASSTQLGAIASELRLRPPPNEFERGTRQFGMLIMRYTVLLVLFVLLVNLYFHRPWLETFLFAVALAVGLTPELLPMIVSVTLARGALRMARREVIVKQLSAIENLGSMDVLCTDKTGTLTEASIHLERHIDGGGTESARVLELAYVNSHFESGLKSPLDTAILEHHEIDVSAWRKIDEVPFDFERRRVSVLAQRDDTRALIVKGAPEDILRLSNAYETEAERGPRALDEATRKRMQALCDELGGDGFRVLGIAWKAVPEDHPHAVVDDETGLVFVGFAAFLDPPKASAGPALQALRQSGVEVKILTGDNEHVTQYICRALGIEVKGVLTGAELSKMDEPALTARLGRVNVLCRLSPAQKSWVIHALRRRGHTVGFLGDGINDAPPLHAADVGVSVDGGTDVAKEAAAMILLRSDLNVLHEGVLEGRRTFGNVMKYIMMGTSSNFGNMFSMAGAAVILPFLPMLPVQILLNNLLYDVSELAIPLDEVDEEDLERPRQWDMRFVRNFMIGVGPVSSAFDFLTFYVLLYVFHADQTLFRSGWFVESIATQVLVIFIIRTRRPPWASRPHPALVFAALAVVALALALPYTPAAAHLGFTPLPPAFLGMLAGLVVVYLAAVEVVKRWFYGRIARHGSGR